MLDKRDKLKRELDSQLVQHKDRDRKAEEDRKKEQEDMRMRFEAMNKDAQDKQALVDRKSLVQKGYRLTQIEEKNARLAKEQKEKIAAEQWYIFMYLSQSHLFIYCFFLVCNVLGPCKDLNYWLMRRARRLRLARRRSVFKWSK